MSLEKLHVDREGGRTPEQIQLVNALNGQYEHARDVWTEKFPVDPSLLASREEVGDWLEALSGKILDGIGEFKNSARLVMRPAGITDPQLIDLINANKTFPNQGTSEIFDEVWENVVLAEPCFGITDGREDMPFDKTVYYKDSHNEKDPRTFEEEVEAYESQYKAKALSTMPQYGYLPTTMGALAQGRRGVDPQYWTSFKKPAGATLQPYAYWHHNCFFRVELSGNDPSLSRVLLRCRPWVEGRTT